MTGQETATPVRIAIAEDDGDLRKAFVGMLELLGNQVVCAAADGAELLQCCHRDQVDLAVVDLDMPVVDGLQAAEEIAERGIPVVLVSGHPDVEEIVLEHEPVVTRIFKPATLESFRKAIAEALAGKSE
jgi:DNA-binding NtrC family response regulator